MDLPIFTRISQRSIRATPSRTKKSSGKCHDH
jgi:hypothetical protein